MKCHFMQIVSKADNLHEMSNPVFWENKKNVNFSYAEFSHKEVKLLKMVSDIFFYDFVAGEMEG